MEESYNKNPYGRNIKSGIQDTVSEKKQTGMNDTHKKIVSIIGLLIFLLFSGLVAYYIGKPMMQHLSEPEKFREWVQGYGIFGWLICIGMMALQIIVAIIPGGALEIGAGYAYGAFQGTILCVIGSVIGSVVVFQFVRCFGIKLVEAFFSIEKIRALKFLHDERKRNILAFIIFLMPGTPKDLLSYFMGLTDMSLKTWLIISTVARTPAIIITAMSGDALGEKEYHIAVIVMIALFIVSLIGAACYKKLCKNKK